MINCITQIGLGFAGIVLTILYMVQDYLFDGEFDWRVFLCKHKAVIIITSSIIILLSVIINIEPEAGEILKTVTTMDITTAPHAFLLLAPAIYAGIYSKSSSNRRTKLRKAGKDEEETAV